MSISLQHMQTWINVFLKFFFLLTPFFVLSILLAMTAGWQTKARHALAVRVTIAVLIICAGLFLFGSYVFTVFGITLDAFRVGAGALLFLSGLSLTRGEIVRPAEDDGGIAVVPLAIPITVGPATTGALLVMSGELTSAGEKILAGTAMLSAALVVGVMLFTSGALERRLGRTGLGILSKLTGLILVSMAAQMIFTGARNLMASGHG